MAFLTHEDYSLLYRLQQAGPVTMKFNLPDTFTDKPVPASITVAEIKGSEHPDERVIIGGHLDSWDLGQGALDNGTGAMATLEAARTLQALGWKPKRTITFILFTGEEQGGIGAETFHQESCGGIGENRCCADSRHRNRQGLQHRAGKPVGDRSPDDGDLPAACRRSSTCSRSARAISAHRTTCRF